MKIAVPIIAALAFAIPTFAANNNGVAKTVAHRNAARMAWAPQTLTGTIAIVDPAHRLVVIQTDGGVPYDLDVSRQTKIENGNQRMSLQSLNQDVSQKVSVKLIPERRGDVAAWIRVGGAS